MKRYTFLLSTLFIYNLQANRETTPNEIRLVSQEESKSCESQKITVEPSVPKWKKYLRNIQYGIIGTQLTMSVWIILNIWTLPKNILSSIPGPVQKAISNFGYTTQDFKIYESPLLGVNAFVTFLDKLIIIGKDLLKYGGKDIPHFLIGHEIAHKELSHPLK